MGYNAEYNILSDTCKCRYGYEQVGSRCVLESSSNTDYSYLYSLLNSGSATEVCPLNSYLATDDLCYCNTGYELNNAENACVKKTCSINSKLIGGQCTCNSGFVKSGDSCITYTDSCKLSFGENVYGFWNSEGKHLCQCNSGYEWSGNRTTCLKRKTCPNGYVNSSGNCSCNGGYVWDNINSNCIPRPTTYVDEKILREKEIKDFVDEEKKLIKDTDEKLTKKLKGKILLQVEDKGEAWYVNPKDEKKYYMADGEKAYDIMRDLGVGVTNKDLEDIKNSAIKAKKHSGKIFLQVESLGEAYYIDFDGKAHYLKDGEAAYSIMRELGLGITNNDLRKININD